MEGVRACGALVVCLLVAAPGAAQSRVEATQGGGGSLSEATALARVWSLLSQRSYASASEQAQEVLRRYPRSAGALAVAVEAAIAHRGATAGLDEYERWLGQRSLEEPGVLRRIAGGFLSEAANVSGTRLAALRDLSADGDESATAALAALARQGGGAEARALAAMGNQEAAAVLVGQLNQGVVDPVATMAALGDSGYAGAIGPVTARLRDARPEVRGAAAEAVGKLGSASPGDAVAVLAPLLSDQSPYVRTRAASALYRLGDQRGTPWLLELAGSDVPAGRLAAAEAMSSRPDQAWMSLVTELAAPGMDPEIRLGAARLIAPHDPGLARSVGQEMSNNGNPAIRELAVGLWVEAVSGEGLATLRGLLRTGDERRRLSAAARILALTR